jgi:CRISPR system Cascade subunit CasE
MSELHLHQWVLDTRALLAFARTQGLLLREVDDGYVVHAALAALLGERAPRPFVIESALDPIRRDADEGAPARVVLAYGDAPLDALEEHAAPAHRGLVRWDRSMSKRMPSLEPGRTLGFVARVTPTVRSRAPWPDRPGGGRGHAREVDAFLAACARAPQASVDRAAVYRDWLARELSAERGTASPAELVDFGLRRFERARLVRKEQVRKEQVGEPRKRHVVERPDAVVTGALRVNDAAAFRALLRRGVGRHRAFGFGMLLVRRA